MKKQIKKILFIALWLFIIGGLLGFIIETFWYYIKNGTWINKQGLWYTPLKPIYGCGLIIITLLLYKRINDNILNIFIYGTLIGSIYEYATSIFQEYVLNTYTWTYQSFNFNINGRIYLPYCFIWGIITLLWIKALYPLFIRFIHHITSKKYIYINYILIIFLLYDITLTTIITYRYAHRLEDTSNKILQYVDKHYPDPLIKRRFPKLRIISK